MVKNKSEAQNSCSSTDEENAIHGSISGVGKCHHVKKSVDTGKLRKLLKNSGLASDCVQCSKTDSRAGEHELNDGNSAFEYDSTLWLCLKCGSQLCGRSKNQHALQHFKTPRSESHCLTMNTRSFEIWCYECDNEVNADCGKNLLECVEFVKRVAQNAPPPSVNNIEEKIVSTWEAMRPLVQVTDNNLPTPNPSSQLPVKEKDANESALRRNMLFNMDVGYALQPIVVEKKIEVLPRVRGLTNLGNTCFFNAVTQCLAQTPYLLEVLKELSEPGENFTLPGGIFKFKDNEDVDLPEIKGVLSSWGGLTAALANTLEELKSGGGVFTPSKVFDKLCAKCPQFRGGDQHDSHELLRHLLESVRSEDLKRYQRVILQSLGYENQDANSASEEMRQKCKIYGGQASDRILCPDQVFRGFLVSTLTCQDCYNVSSRHEYFLDISLPVSVEKPQPPQRRKTSPDNALEPTFSSNIVSVGSKAQLKKERKTKRAIKHQNKKLNQKIALEGLTTENQLSTVDGSITYGCPRKDEISASSSSSPEQSDADVEDNLIDDNISNTITRPLTAPILFDANGNNDQLANLPNKEKCGDSPENECKDSQEEDENDSGIANSPANAGKNFLNTVTNSETTNSIVSVGLSEKGASLLRHLSCDESQKSEDINAKLCNLSNGKLIDEDMIAAKMEKIQLRDRKAARKNTKRVRTQSHSDWSTTVAPRYQCEDGECSVQSCLNNFTAIELMTGSNKVRCDNCTKRINGDDPNAKSVNTNATKQYLISSPPAVLILHLKRFQLGPRGMFRKLTRAVTFPMILDIAPFCGSKVKNLPNINRKQKKLLYALYGVVEHSGNMYGGHYTAYVKVRPTLSPDDQRWKFIPQGSKAELDQSDEQRQKLEELLAKEKARELRLKADNDSDDFSNSSTTSSSSELNASSDTHDEENGVFGGDEEARNVEMPMGTWYYVSDSRVQEVNEDVVLKSQAYLLFYERIY